MPKELDERFGKIDRGDREETSPRRRPTFRFSILYQYLPAIFILNASLCLFVIGAGNLGLVLYSAIHERDQIVEFALLAAAFAAGNFLYFTAGLLGLLAGVALWRAKWRGFAIALVIALALFIVAMLLFPL